MTQLDPVRKALHRINRAITEECSLAKPDLGRVRKLYRQRLILRNGGSLSPLEWVIFGFIVLMLAIAGVRYSTAHAQPLEELRAHCVARVEETYHCTTACVNRLWPIIARCTNQQRAVDPGKLELCMKPIFRARFVNHTPELVGDPVAEAFSCARR